MKLFSLLFLGLMLFGCTQSDQKTNVVEDSISLTDQWVRPGAKDGNTAAFLKIENKSSEDDMLLSAASDIAKVVEIHETFTRENDMKGMRHVEQILIPSKSTVELKPGGYHIMLIGLKNDLPSGETVKVQLNFKQGGIKEITAEVGTN